MSDDVMCWAGRVGISGGFALLLGMGASLASIPLYGTLIARPLHWSAAQVLAAGCSLPPASDVYGPEDFASAILGGAIGHCLYLVVVSRAVAFDYVWSGLATAVAGEFVMANVRGWRDPKAKTRPLFCCGQRRRLTSKDG